jgi:hypothetical protein
VNCRLEAKVPHASWPENGCTLAEARERTADRVRWNKWKNHIVRSFTSKIQKHARAHDNSRRVPLKPAVAYEEMINADFVLQMRAMRLIAYGRPRGISVPPQLIMADKWSALRVIEWERSTVGQAARDSAVFHEVRVYPAMLAPCRVDLVAGLSLAQAFKKFVLEDPEFAALASYAVRFDKAAKSMLQEGKFARQVTFDWQWPIDLTPFANFVDVINDAYSFGVRRQVIGEQPQEACEVLRDRYERLLRLCRSGEVVARGTHVLSGIVGEIDVQQWSRSSGWIDTRSGDFLEEIDNKLVARWTGLSFLAPRKTAAFDSIGRRGRGCATLDGRAPSTGDRPRRVGDAVAEALRAKGLDSSPGSRTWKQIAHLIADDMPKRPKTVLEFEALSKAVKRYYDKR